MKKILLFLLLFLPLKLFAQDVIVIDPGTFGGGIINIDPWLSLDPLLDSVQNWIWVSKDNQTDRETGTMMLPYNTIQEGWDNVSEGGVIIVLAPRDNSSYEEHLVMSTANVRMMTLEGQTVAVELQSSGGAGMDIDANGLIIGGGSGNGFTFTFNAGLGIVFDANRLDVEISYNDITAASGSIAINVGASGSTRLKILNNTFHVNDADGAFYAVKSLIDVEIIGNEFIIDHGAASGYCIQMSGFYNGIVAYNYIHADTSDASPGVSGIFPHTNTSDSHASDSLEIYGNIIQDCADGVRLGHINGSDMKAIFVYDNIIERCVDGVDIYNDAEVFPATYYLYDNKFKDNTNDINNNHATTYNANNTIEGVSTIVLTDTDGGGNGLYINNIFTKVGAIAHKAILSEVTYTPAGIGTANPIGVVGKVNLNGNLTASPTSTFPGYGWGVQGQIHMVDGTEIDGSTYGVPGAIYAGLRGVVTDDGTSTYTKGALTGLYSEIQITQENANDLSDFNIYGLWIRNQGTVTSTDVEAGLFIDANFSFPNTFLKGIDINDAVMGIEISATTTGIDFTSSMTQEIIGQNDETIDNAVDGVWDFGTADLTTIGRLSALKTTEQLRLSYDATNYLTVTLADDGHTTFVTVDPDGAEADIVFMPDGNVGIGTDNPRGTLEVKGPNAGDVGGFPAGVFQVTAEGATQFIPVVITGHNSYNGNTQLWYLGSVSSSNDNITFINRQNADLSFSTNDINRMTISGAGAVDVVNDFTAGTMASDAGVTATTVFLAGDGAVGTPSFSLTSDPNTGLYTTGADAISVSAGGVEAVRFVENTTTQALFSDGTAALPSISFINDPDCGFYRLAANEFRIALGGGNNFTFSTTAFTLGSSLYPHIARAEPTSTTPVFFPRSADGNTGIGWAGLDSLSLIAGSVEGIRIAEGDGNIKVTITDTLQVNGFYNGYQTDGSTSLYWHEYNISAFSTDPGASGATLTAPTANTLGGYQLDLNTEQLYYSTHVEDDWDGITDLIMEVWWEVNEIAAADGTVDLQLISYYKGDHESANKTQTEEVPHTITGNKAQFTQHMTIFTINFDEGGNVVDEADVISFILNLETDTSECDDIIINYAELKYRTTKPATETY